MKSWLQIRIIQAAIRSMRRKLQSQLQVVFHDEDVTLERASQTSPLVLDAIISVRAMTGPTIES